MSIETKHPVASMQETHEFRSQAASLEKMMAENGALVSHDTEKLCPVNHAWGHKLYVREWNSPAHVLTVSKIHKFEHPFFVLEGEVSVLTEAGLQRITAPYYGMTQPGAKRILYTHTKTKWVTVHGTDRVDIEEIEEEIIAKDFDCPEITAADMERIAQGAGL